MDRVMMNSFTLAIQKVCQPPFCYYSILFIYLNQKSLDSSSTVVKRKPIPLDDHQIVSNIPSFALALLERVVGRHKDEIKNEQINKEDIGNYYLLLFNFNFSVIL